MNSPILSICIPTYNRPTWLRRAILSVIEQGVTHRLELLISDNSLDSACREVAYDCLRDWRGAWEYNQNVPSVSMVENFNRLILRAGGQFILMLSDDDYLLPGRLANLIGSLESHTNSAACLFGVHVVDREGRVKKRSGFTWHRYLPPELAVKRLLTNSSFVRFPALAVKRSVLIDCGLFNPETPNICDLDMWLKVFSSHGVQCVPSFVSAYTVHQEAGTMAMFRPQILELLLEFFDRVESSGLVPARRLATYRSLFFHQYILAGTYRNLRWNGLAAARTTLTLFDHDGVRRLRRPLKWMFLRELFEFAIGRPHANRSRTEAD